MKTATSVLGEGTDAIISPSLMKAEYFLIVDPEDSTVHEKIVNRYGVSTSGADIFCSQLLISKGVNNVVCGSCEPDAKRIFKEANVKVIENVSGPIFEHLVKFSLNNESILDY
jgi:predicted Fe-Mo cluster-binding NifX family protein